MDEDDMYVAGSDDFRGYVWRIPPLISLQGLRREITAYDWYTREWPDTVGEHIRSVSKRECLIVHQLLPKASGRTDTYHSKYRRRWRG